ncbi:MAG: tetratricopeptide repeat protein [Desulfovibrionaceae bacterium]
MAENKTLGIYSSEAQSFIGTGMTKRKAVTKRYWLAMQSPDGRYFVQPVNRNMVPTGDQREVPAEEFAASYMHEPEFFVAGDRRIWKSKGGEKVVVSGAGDGGGIGIDLDGEGDDPLGIDLGGEENGFAIDLADDEMFGGVTDGGQGGLAIDLDMDQDKAPVVLDDEDYAPEQDDPLEHDARAEFGIGLTYLKRGDRGKAKEVFEELAERKGDYTRRHKHMFNDFGIGLRKSKLLDTSIKLYLRALELHPDDENICHNIARVYYESGDLDQCESFLKQALERNPRHRESQLFLKFLRRKQRTGRGGEDGGKGGGAIKLGF